MNKYQRGVLIGAGILIASIQIIGINDYGLDDSKGWAISFLISALLLFIGFSSPDWVEKVFRRHKSTNVAHNDNITDVKESVQVVGHTENKANSSSKFNYGHHISELDVAIGTHINYAKEHSIHNPMKGNGKSINWSCCASVYASMRYAAMKSDLKINKMIWNTILHTIVVRMATKEKKNISMGTPGYNELENEAYKHLEAIDQMVVESLQGKGKYTIEPLVNLLITMFGCQNDSNADKALRTMVLINADVAYKKIIPELVEIFS